MNHEEFDRQSVGDWEELAKRLAQALAHSTPKHVDWYDEHEAALSDALAAGLLD